jgi:peptidoglycan/xylan/chitin deacetylase (PgdA/CDA1 family)
MLLIALLLLGCIAVIAVSLLFFQPNFLLRWLTRKTPEVFFFVDTPERAMALTIDDGPHPQTTPLLLDLLAEFGIKATFFLISVRVVGYESIVKRIVNEGHEIGNHNTKDQPSIGLTDADFAQQLDESHSILSKFGQVTVYRPGSGWYNRNILKRIRHYNYLGIIGSIYPYDPHIPFAGFSVFHILVNSAPGSIIVLHDGDTRGRRTLATLRQVIPKLQKRGYKLCTVSELLAGSNEVSRPGRKL